MKSRNRDLLYGTTATIGVITVKELIFIAFVLAVVVIACRYFSSRRRYDAQSVCGS
jgi:hypothetical protein